MTAQLSPELLARVQAALDACTTAEEAKKYFAETPEGGQAHNMAFHRWVELAAQEQPHKIANCNTVAEAVALYTSAPPGTDVQDAYETHWMRLLFPE